MPIQNPTDQPVPHVGIFWRIVTATTGPTLLVDSVEMADAEPYGDFLTHGGHYDFWSKLAEMTAAELRQRGLPDVARWSEYDEWPRGRVVLNAPTGRFIIYADRKLTVAPMIERIAAKSGLPEGWFDVRRDGHYVSVR
jgi:hypothetical protein